MPSISKFSSNMSKGFARPNLFKVEISKVQTSQQEKYQMSCFQAQIPGHNIATTDKDIGFRSIAYQKIYSDVILGFYVAADLAELEFWQHWIDKIIDKQTNHHNYYNKYVGEVMITQENRAGHDVATWTLKDAYPKQIDPIQLDYGTNDAVMTCNVTMTYRHYTVDYKNVVKIDPKQGEAIQYAHHVRTDMNKDDIMLETIDKNENWKFGWKQQTIKEIIAGHGNWNTYDKSEKLAALKAGGITGIHGESMTGGAISSIIEQK